MANHTAGSDSFDYATKAGNDKCATYGSWHNTSRYFLDGCVAAFDHVRRRFGRPSMPLD